MRFSWSKFNGVVIYILMFLDKFVSFSILDSLIAITSKVLLAVVALSKHSRSSKLLFKEREFVLD